MNQEVAWTAVDKYFESAFILSDSILDQVLKNNEAAGLPAHDVSPNQGKLLQLYVQLTGAKRVLEIGTLGAYSSIWMARALPANGKLISLEVDPLRAEVARKNISLADLQSKIEVRIGPALESLPILEEELKEPFDFIFIDADKVNNPSYFSWALKLSQKGSLIVIDNVVRNGAVIEVDNLDPNVQGVRQLTELIEKETRVQATVVQTVGVKGWDGYILAMVTK